jgi:hypothetical protein
LLKGEVVTRGEGTGTGKRAGDRNGKGGEEQEQERY